MQSVNKVILVGYLAANPDISESPPGKRKVTFPIAIHRERTSNGDKREVTDYHRIVAWGKLADVCKQYLVTGQGVYVEGTLLNRAFEKNGERRFVTEICADEVNMLMWKKTSDVEALSVTEIRPT